MRAFAAFPAARLRGKRDLALFFKGNVTQTKSLMRTVMGHARRETVAFRQRRAADTARWRRLNHSLASRGAGAADLLQLRTQPLHLRRGAIGHRDEF